MLGVGFQANGMKLNTSVLDGATAYLTSFITQLPLGKTCCHTFDLWESISTDYILHIAI